MDKENALKGHGIGVYFCFCRDQSNFEQLMYGETDEVCAEFNTMHFNHRLQRFGSSALVIIMDVLIRMVN